MTPIRSIIATSILFAFAGALAAQQGGNGYIKTKISPSRAGVFVDGKYVGPAGNFAAARKYAVSPGEHEIKLVEPRYQEVTTKVSVTAGKTTVVRETMKPMALAKPPFGRLRTMSADKFAAVYVNGKYVGHADEFSNFAQGLLLNPGTYDVKIEPVSGAKVVEQKVTIVADKVTIVK